GRHDRRRGRPGHRVPHRSPDAHTKASHTVTLDLSAFLPTHNPELIHLRRHLHAHPELGKADPRPTALAPRRVEPMDLAPPLLSTGTGLICAVGAGDGPTVA